MKAMKVHTQKNIKTTFLLVLLIKLFVLMIGLANEMLFIEVKMLLMNLLRQFLRSINITKSNEQKFDYERKRRTFISTEEQLLEL